jgi:hypothetical protein
MSYEIPGGLSSFVCPLIVSPALALGEPKNYQCAPPFPGIDHTLEGFTIRHLHWIGINTTKQWRRKPLVWLAVLHEINHLALSVTLYLRYTNYEMANFYSLIYETFIEGREKIEVPLRRDLPRNKLEIQWKNLTLLKEGSRLIEEVSAVQSSLLKAQKERSIKPELGEEILSYYKGAYDEQISGFQLAYEAFDLIAKTLGDIIAKAIVTNVLNIGNPDRAFWDIIWRMCELKSGVPTNNIVLKLSRKETNFLANLSIGEACDYFSYLLDSLDKDDLRYRKKMLRKYIATAEQKLGALTKGKYDFYKFILGTPEKGVLFSYYNNYGFHKLDLEDFGEVDFRYLYILLESILQQLVTGKGLACPFWEGPDTECCGSECRELLEQVWRNTKAVHSWLLWMRLGCLAQDGGAH